MLGLVLVPPTAFVAPSRSTIVVPARAAVRLESERPETEMEYLKRKFDEKGERGGGWSIFKAKGDLPAGSEGGKKKGKKKKGDSAYA